MRFILTFPALALFVSVRSQVHVNDGSYTVCQNFKGTFDPVSIHRDDNLQGLPGKRGPKGDKGSLGNIEESEIVLDLANQLKSLKECDGLFTGGICYYALEDRVNHETATSECQKSDGKLASINSRQLYGAVFSLVHDRFVSLQSQTYLQFWIDGRYENGGVTLFNGEKMPFLLWYPGYPRTPASENRMGFEVKKVASSAQHMFNVNGAHVAYPLCQRP